MLMINQCLEQDPHDQRVKDKNYIRRHCGALLVYASGAIDTQFKCEAFQVSGHTCSIYECGCSISILHFGTPSNFKLLLQLLAVGDCREKMHLTATNFVQLSGPLIPKILWGLGLFEVDKNR
mmetsp:Transcript_4405/g.9319  ORF Transcript_4405/g.9319 Transcript_4405/m.9319 type:complete len:122 (+) Transcript_4405:208-573(+)